jgi:hypothetical protein
MGKRHWKPSAWREAAGDKMKTRYGLPTVNRHFH